MNNEHLPRIPYVRQEDPESDWRDVPITSGQRNLKAELRSTTSPLDAQKLVDSFYEESKKGLFQEESLTFRYNPYEPEDAENIRNYLVKVKDLLSEWEASGGLKSSEPSTKDSYKELIRTIAKLEKTLDVQEKTLKKFNASRESEEEEFADQLEERIEDIVSDLESIGEQYQHFLSVDNLDTEPVLMIEKQESADVLMAENELLREYLSAMGFSDDQIEAKTALLPEVEGRRRLVDKAYEWSLLNREGLLGEVSGKVGRAAQYLDSIKAHVPEHMADRYADLTNKLNIEVKPALDSYERFLRGAEGAADEWNSLQQLVRELLKETSSFSADFVGSQQDVSLNAPEGQVEDNRPETEEVDAVSRTPRRLVVEPRKPSEKITTFMRQGEPLSATSYRVFPGGSYPEQFDPKRQNQSETIMSGDLLAHLEREAKDILDEFKNQVEHIRVSLYEQILPAIREDVISDDDKSNLKFLHSEFQNVQALLVEAEKELAQSGEVSSETVDGLSGYCTQLQTAISYYEDRMKAGDELFGENENAPLEEAEESVPSSNPVPQESYENLRAAWLEAKKIHDEKHAQYLSAVDQYYTDWASEVEAKGLMARSWTKLRAKFGIKPELPDDVSALRDDAFAASAVYNQYAREMTEKRELAGKKSRGDISPEVLNRYNRRFAHEILLNTFSGQIDSQEKAVERLGFKPNAFTARLLKNKNYVKVLGAAAVGAATGALVPAGAWLVRSIVGGAAGAGVGKYTNDKLGARIENWKAENYEAEIVSLAEKINNKSLSAEELQAHYEQLETLMAKVDEKTRRKLIAVLAAAGLAGVLVGGGAGAAGEELFGWGGDTGDIAGSSEDPVAGELSDSEASPATDEGVRSNPDNTSRIDVGATEAAENNTAYTAEKGDNLWDIMEGQTSAGELGYLDNVAEGDKQRLIALVTERVNQDAALRAELGFGSTADHLQIGAEVDVERLNELAEEIAREKNLYIENPSEITTAEGSEESLGQAEAETTDTEATSEGVAELPGVATDALLMKEVRPNDIIEFARQYEGGYTKFETDFQTLFVERIQGPAPADSLLGRIFGAAPNSADAFKIFGAYPVSEFNELATLDQAELAQALTKEQIDMQDYLAWRDELARWQEEGLVINPSARFSDVAETAFINSLNQPRTT